MLPSGLFCFSSVLVWQSFCTFFFSSLLFPQSYISLLGLQPKPVKRCYLFHAASALASFAPFSCLRWQDLCRWFLVTLKYTTVFPLWQMDLRLLVLNKCRFTIHNFTGFVLYITGLNILSQNSSAWHFQLIQGPCQFF